MSDYLRRGEFSLNYEEEDFGECRRCGNDFRDSTVVGVKADCITLHCSSCDGYYEIPNSESQRAKLRSRNDDIPDFRSCRLCAKEFVYSFVTDVEEETLTLHCQSCDGYYEVPNRESQRELLRVREKTTRSGVSAGCQFCDAHFVMSSAMERKDGVITLHCSQCDNMYEVKDTADQQKLLKHTHGIPTQVDRLSDVTQIIPGDEIKFKRLRGLYHHHAIVTEVNRKTGKLRTVEFGSEVSKMKATVKKSKDLDFEKDIAKNNCWVQRYMPLDCLPVLQVVRNAEWYAENPDKIPDYDLLAHNCQHLSSWLKTGERVSKEGWVAEEVVNYISMGVDIVAGILTSVPNETANDAGIFIAVANKFAKLYRAAKKRGLRSALRDVPLLCAPETIFTSHDCVQAPIRISALKNDTETLYRIYYFQTILFSAAV